MPKNRMTIDKLAVMIVAEFEAVRRETSEGFASVRETLSDHSARFNRIERKLDNTIERGDDHTVRLERLEKHRRL